LAAAWLVTADAEGIMILMSLVMGLANGLFIISQAPFMMESSSPRERTLLFSLQFGLITLSGAAGNLLAGYLPAWFATLLKVGPESALAYQAVLSASVWVGGISLIPLWFIREGRWPDQESHVHLNLDFLRKFVSPTVLRLAIPNLIIGCGAAALIPYLALYFKDQYHISDNTLGWLYSLLSIVTGVATIIGPRLANRLGGKMRAVVVMQGISLVFLLLVGFAPWYWVAGLAFLLRGAMMNMANPLYSAFAMEQIPHEERGAVNSVMHLTWDFGWATVPYFSGLVQRYYGFAPLFITTATLYGIAVALTWFFWRSHQSETA
jgi:predicted MFS family arabinose efflux permease